MMESLSASVTIDRGASIEEVEGVREAFQSVGISAEVRAGYGTKSEAEAWMVMVTIALDAFLRQLGTEAAKDAWRRLKELIDRVTAARSVSKQRPGTIVFQDSETRAQVVFGDDLPDEAYEELLRVKVSKFPAGPLHYYVERRRWVSRWGKQGEDEQDDSED